MKSLSSYITEKYGMSDDVKNCADEILKYIKNNTIKDNSFHYFSHNKGVFKDRKIVVNIKNNNMGINGSFFPFESFTDILMLLEYDLDYPDYEELYPIIIHELTHALEYINLSKKDIINNDDPKYRAALNYIDDPKNIEKDDYDYEDFFHDFTYYTDPHERLAYMSQIYKDVEDIIKKENITRKNLNYKKLFYELIENEFVIHNIYTMIANLEKICNFKKPESKKKVVDTYNRIYNDNKTFNQLVKFMKLRLDKFENKLNNILPKIIFDVINKIENKDKNHKDVKTKLKKCLEENK